MSPTKLCSDGSNYFHPTAEQVYEIESYARVLIEAEKNETKEKVSIFFLCTREKIRDKN
jgi:hypothetical protein